MKSIFVLSTLTVLLSRSAFAGNCWALDIGYPCCSTSCDVIFTDADGI